MPSLSYLEFMFSYIYLLKKFVFPLLQKIEVQRSENHPIFNSKDQNTIYKYHFQIRTACANEKELCATHEFTENEDMKI